MLYSQRSNSPAGQTTEEPLWSGRRRCLWRQEQIKALCADSVSIQTRAESLTESRAGLQLRHMLTLHSKIYCQSYTLHVHIHTLNSTPTHVVPHLYTDTTHVHSPYSLIHGPSLTYIHSWFLFIHRYQHISILHTWRLHWALSDTLLQSPWVSGQQKSPL